MGYAIIRLFIFLIVRLICRMDVRDMDRLPKSGSYVVAANHLGRLDPALVYYLLDRRDVIIFVAEKYRSNRLAVWLTKQLDGIFVDRYNADASAVRKVLRRIEQGQVLVIAPEGTRSPTEALLEAHAGAAFLAAKANATIFPVACWGTEDRAVKSNLKRLRRSPVILQVGMPFTLPPLKGPNKDAQLKEYTDEIMCRIAVMLPEKYRGEYADHARLQALLQEGTPNQATSH